jgi:hypothetical protein
MARWLLNFMQREKIMGVANNRHAIKNSHILQYFSSLDVHMKWSQLEKEAWLSLEEDIFSLKWKWRKKVWEKLLFI